MTQSRAIGKYGMDLCRGPLLRQIIQYAVPFYLATLLQLLFHAADLIVVGRYASYEAMAAVGSVGSITTLSINIFLGLSIGTNVMAANYFGARDHANLSRTIHTAIYIALAGGLLCGFCGFWATPTLLRWMSSPPDVIDKATAYMRIFFLGTPMLLLYNYGSAVLRAIGDTKRPLYYLAIAGVANVCLNLVFVLLLHRDADGVAWATILSQGISGLLVLRALSQLDDSYRFQFKNLHIHGKILQKMLGIGVPAAVQSSCFSIANVLIQSSVNTFGSMAVAGNAAAISLEGLIYVGSYTFHYTAITFTGQNLGGGQFSRIRRTAWECLLLGTGITLVIPLAALLWGNKLLGLYNSTPEVIDWGMRRLYVLFLSYFFCGSMDAISGSLRGLGHSLMSALGNLGGVCLLRIVWIYTYFQSHHTMEALMFSYPLSWAAATLFNGIFLLWYLHKLPRENAPLP